MRKEYFNYIVDNSIDAIKKCKDKLREFNNDEISFYDLSKNEIDKIGIMISSSVNGFIYGFLVSSIISIISFIIYSIL